jgi:hypothetical protein
MERTELFPASYILHINIAFFIFHLILTEISVYFIFIIAINSVQRMEENRIPKRVLYMNLESTRPRVRPRNRWQEEVREYRRIVDVEEWQEKVYNREEWKKLLRTARNRRILHMPVE